MKNKIFSLMAVVMISTSLMSVAPEVEFEEDGRASDCASYWRNAVMQLAADNNQNPNTDLIGNTSYIDIYLVAYTACVNG